MTFTLSDLLDLLEWYVRRELDLSSLHDQVSLNLQLFFDHASEEDIEILSEVHAAMYEVEDGVMPEEEFRRGLRHLIREESSPRIITAGDPRPVICRHAYLSSSTAAGDSPVIMRAA